MSDRNEVVEHNTEDKDWWCLHGENLENRFIEICHKRKELGLNAIINPEKQANRYAPDLIVNGRLADLKSQNTPFFVSSRYGLNPRYAVTFNRKDYVRYKKEYPNIDIYYWIEWKQTEWKDRHVDYLVGIYMCPFAEIAKMIEEEHVPEHAYIHRVFDTGGNAKSSFLLDVRRFRAVFQQDKQ